MAFERREFQELLDERRKSLVFEHRSGLRQMAQAEVPITHLTQSVEWDYFLSILQAQIEEMENALVSLQQSQITDLNFDPGELAARKALAMRLAVQRDTLQSVMALPSRILEVGEKARLELVQYDES